MKSRIFQSALLFSFALFVPFLNCSNEPNPLNESLEPFQFPLSMNNQWNYRKVERFSNCDPDSYKPYGMDSLLFYIEYKITSTETIHDSITVYLMTENMTFITYPEGWCRPEIHTYYGNTTSGMYDYSYKTGLKCNGTDGRLADIGFSSRGINVLRSRKYFEPSGFSALADTIVLRSNPRKYLEYPLEIGREWVFVDGEVKITKKVIGIERIKVQAGEFDCYKIQYSYDDDDGDTEWDTDLEVNEYIAEQGLILETVFQKKFGVAGGVNPPVEPDGYCEYEMRKELMSFNLQ